MTIIVYNPFDDTIIADRLHSFTDGRVPFYATKGHHVGAHVVVAAGRDFDIATLLECADWTFRAPGAYTIGSKLEREVSGFCRCLDPIHGGIYSLYAIENTLRISAMKFLPEVSACGSGHSYFHAYYAREAENAAGAGSSGMSAAVMAAFRLTMRYHAECGGGSELF